MIDIIQTFHELQVNRENKLTVPRACKPAMKVPHKILIIGLPKSATTGLYNDIIKALLPKVVGIFEPRDNRNLINNIRIQNSMRCGSTLVVKLVCVSHNSEEFNIIRVPVPDYESFNHYDKKIFLIRDPRDNLISYMLYMVVNSKYLIRWPNAMKLIDIIKEKENEPGKVSVHQILRLMGDLNSSDFVELLLRWRDFSDKYLNDNQGLFIYKYENYVTRDMSSLEEYLGFQLKNSSDVPEYFRFVARTRKSGDWRNWFLEEDVEFFKPHFQSYMDKYGYIDDWTLPDKPFIDPVYGSKYVSMLVEDFHNKFTRSG